MKPSPAAAAADTAIAVRLRLSHICVLVACATSSKRPCAAKSPGTGSYFDFTTTLVVTGS